MSQYYDAVAISTYVSRAIKDGDRGTQAGLSRAAGVSPPTIDKWKNMHTCPSHTYWPAIEEFFGWEPGTLAGVGGVAPTTTTEVETAILQAKELDDDEKHVMLSVYRLFTRQPADGGRQ